MCSSLIYYLWKGLNILPLPMGIYMISFACLFLGVGLVLVKQLINYSYLSLNDFKMSNREYENFFWITFDLFKNM